MGVKSLTTYLENRKSQYFEDYRLHDCRLVIDGSSLAFKLYNWNQEVLETGYSYGCYGGDYDKYAEIVKGLFKMLKQCNVEPYVVFGGLNGTDRVSSVIKRRLNDTMEAANKITPNAIRRELTMTWENRSQEPNQGLAIGAVALKFVFRDILNELNLKTFTCEEDPNREMASLAKYFDCPVLSANSDFFVLGSMFILSSSLGCQIKENVSGNADTYRYIPCQIYKIENLLHALKKRPDNNFIPYLLPILLGSEFIDSDIFASFFRALGIGGRIRRQQKVDSIFRWISSQSSLEVAIQRLLSSFNETEKGSASAQINHVIMSYSPVSIIPILRYFGIEPEPPNPKTFLKVELDNIRKTDNIGSELFSNRLRECRYPGFFADMLKENRYLILPNIDDNKKPDANSIGYGIMAAIHNILVQNCKEQLTVFRRNSNVMIEEYVLPSLTDQLPSIEEIDYLSLESRLNILINILEVDQSFCQIFEGLSKEWHLFLLSLKYATSKSKLEPSFIYSLVLCFMILNYVDLNLNGFYRTAKKFNRSCKLKMDESEPGEKIQQNKFPKITGSDSFTFMKKCIKYFEMDNEDNDETYDKGIMHSIAEFHCVFVHLKYLNNLFDFPVQDTALYKVSDNTFIYNMTKNLKNVSNFNNYLHNFMQDCPSINSGFFYVMELLKDHFIV